MLPALRSSFYRIREALTPSATGSLVGEGSLTPDEFVGAGDALVRACPLWHWAAGDASLRNAALPPLRQYLLCCGVPATDLAKQGGSLLNEPLVEAEGGWVSAPSSLGHTATRNRSFSDLTVSGANPPLLQLDDPAAVAPSRSPAITDALFDVSICYDSYRRSPRLFLCAMAGVGGERLPPTTLLERFCSTEYVSTTVTVEPHPAVLSSPQLSIHPCKHAGVMRLLLAGCPAEDKLAAFLPALLKFAGSVCPSLVFDFTPSLTVANEGAAVAADGSLART